MIKLVAIDLDGTLFDSHSSIPKENREAIRLMAEKGIYPVVSTGRPLKGIPVEVRELPFAYAITANGGAIYDLRNESCLYENCFDRETTLDILDFLDDKYIHLDCFIDGGGISTFRSREVGEHLPIPPELKHYILDNRKRVENIRDYILENDKYVQKMTLNFIPKEGCPGEFIDREEIRRFFDEDPRISGCSGGYNNLECTRADASKGIALRELAKKLGLSIDQTMAIGDTENDASIVKAAGIGVAMGNAMEEIKGIADYVTASNDQAGVAQAIRKFCLK